MNSMKFPAFEPIDLRNDTSGIEVVELKLSDVVADEGQPRKQFDPSSLNDLAASIKEHGVIQPIIVKKTANKNKYQIIAGERRWRAANVACLDTIPSIIKETSNTNNIAISLIENIQREGLNPIELAEAFSELSDKYGMTHEEIAKLVGKGRATISNFIRLLNLSESVRNMLKEGKLDMGHARTLLTLSKEDQKSFSEKIIHQNLNVRDAERQVKSHKITNETSDFNIPFAAECMKWSKEFSKLLSSDVKISLNMRGKGKIEIQVNSPEEVAELLESIVIGMR